MDKKLNPGLVFAAAQLAITGVNWVKGVYTDGETCVFDKDIYRCIKKFDPLSSDSDAWALCEAVERRAVVFEYWPHPNYWSVKVGSTGKGGYFPEKKLAVLHAASVLTDIPMWLE